MAQVHLPASLEEPEVEFHYHSRIQNFCFYVGVAHIGMFIVVLLGYVMNGAMDGDPVRDFYLKLVYSLATAAITLSTFYLYEIRYVIDNENKLVLCRRRIFGKGKIDSVIGSLNDVVAIAVVSDRSRSGSLSYWFYSVALLLKNGHHFRIIDWFEGSKSLDDCNHLGAVLSKHLHVTLCPGHPRQMLDVSINSDTGQVEYTHVPYDEGYKPFLVILFLLAIMVLLHY